MIRLFVISLVGVLIALAVRALWVKAKSEGWSSASMLVTSGTIVLAVGLLVLAATGRLHWLFAAGAALLPFFKRLVTALPLLLRYLPLFQSWGAKSSAGRGPSPQPGNDDDLSEVATSELKITLHHESGHMDGEILSGPQAGRLLSELDLAALTTLLSSLREPESKRLLQAYLDRHFAGWNEAHDDSGEASGNGGTAGPMDQAQALEVLGLEPGATKQEITQAHRRLMQRLHPDRGGSNYLAATLNEAKRVLLQQ